MKASIAIFSTAWSLASGFSHWPPASPTLRDSDRLTWSEYHHEYVDPLVPHADVVEGMEELDVECSAEEDDDCYWTANYLVDEESIDSFNNMKAEISREYWTQKHADDQKWLHHLDDGKAAVAAASDAAVDVDGIGKRDTWSHYEHEYIDELHQPLEKAGRPSPVRNPMDAKKRAVADEYWAQKSREEKEKMARMSGMDLLP